MAQDDYLIVPGLTGPGSATIDTASGVETLAGVFQIGTATLGAPEDAASSLYAPLTFTLSAGAAANALVEDAASGTVLASVTLDIVKAGAGSADLLDQIVLTDVTVASAQIGAGGMAFGLDYTAITDSLTVENAAAELTGTISASGTVAAGASFAATPPLASTDIGGKTGYMLIPGITGPITAAGYSGAFAFTQYSIECGGGVDGPLVVTLNEIIGGAGGASLYQDAFSGTVLASATFDIAKGSTIYEQIVLTNAVITNFAAAGPSDQLSFGYSAATITDYAYDSSGSLSATGVTTLGASAPAPAATAPSPDDPAESGTAYLGVPGLTGDVASGDFAGDFTLDGYSLGASTGAGGTVVFAPLTVTMTGFADAAENALLQDALLGTVLPSVTLDIAKTIAGTAHTKATVVLTDATVASVQEADGGVGFVFDYATISSTGTVYNPGGSVNSTANATGTVTPGSLEQAPTLSLTTSPIDTEGFLAASTTLEIGATTLDVSVDYQFTVTGAAPGALALTLSGGGSATLFNDAVAGTILPQVTMLEVASDGSSTETISLTNAVVESYAENGDTVSLSLSYAGGSVSNSAGGAAVATVTLPAGGGVAATSSAVAPDADSRSDYLLVPGIAGDVVGGAYDGGFTLGGESLSAAQTGAGSVTWAPLIVTLSGSPDSGEISLLQDALTGTVLPSVTLDIADPSTGNMLEQVVLTDATIVSAQQAGGDGGGSGFAFGFDYGAITQTTTSYDTLGSVIGSFTATAVVPANASFATVPSVGPAQSGNADDYLFVSGVTNPSGTGIGALRQAFAVESYSFAASGGESGALTLVSALNPTLGAALHQDALSGTVLASVTLDVAESNTIEQTYVLSNVTVDGFSFLTNSGVAAESQIVLDYASMSPGADAIVSCFLAGTRIGVPGGEVAVEALRAGDQVALATGDTARVRWVGHSTVARDTGDPLAVLPVRVRAGALGRGIPARDLLLSPGHALLVGGLLAQAGALVNGASVVREWQAPAAFTYWHVELDRHAILLAEGAPAESFLASEPEMAFDNWQDRAPAPPAAELPYPRVKASRQLPPPIRALLLARAAAMQDPIAA